MGAGAGKTRRTQATPSPFWEKSKRKEVPVFHKEKWEAFVNDGNLNNVSFWYYYLGDVSERARIYSYDNVVTELFADAVAVGAITLPDPYEVEDFQLVSSIPTSTMVLRIKTKPGKSGVGITVERAEPLANYFGVEKNHNHQLGMRQACDIVKALSSVLEDLWEQV